MVVFEAKKIISCGACQTDRTLWHRKRGDTHNVFSHASCGRTDGFVFSPVSDDSLNISSCDESSVASGPFFEILSRLCAVDLAYSVGSLSTTRSDASTSSRAEYIVEKLGSLINHRRRVQL